MPESEQRTQLNSELVGQTNQNGGERVGKGTLAGAAGGGAPKGAGEPLSSAIKSRFESSLGMDLSDVRVHVDAHAAERAASVEATAFATGNEIFFAPGAYKPGTPDGDRLLAHEVAHVAQQRGSKVDPAKLATTSPGDPAERNADAAATKMTGGAKADVAPQPASIAREKPGEGAAKKQPVPTETRDFVKVDDWNLAPQGTVSIRQNASDKSVTMLSPKVAMTPSPTASLVKAVIDSAMTPEEVGRVQVGPIQNVTTSRRVGKYTKPGKPDQVVAEYHSDVKAGSIDQQSLDPKNPHPLWSSWGGKAPFYGPPATLTKSIPSGNVMFWDQPEWTLPTELSGGVLTEVAGSDNFVTSMGVTRDYQNLAQLKAKTWSVPWDAKIDPGTHASADKDKPVSVADSKEMPKTLDGPAANQTTDFYAFTSLDAAIAAGADVLLGDRGLAAARVKDPVSYRFMVDAIRTLNPNWIVTVQADTIQSLWWDNMEVTLQGNRSNKVVKFDLKTGRSDIAPVRFLEICDPESWKEGDAVKFKVKGEKLAYDAIDMTNPKGKADSMTAPAHGGNASPYYKVKATRTP